MTWRAWSSDADGGVRTSILTAQTTPAPDLTRRVTPQNPRSQHYHHDFAEALGGEWAARVDAEVAHVQQRGQCVDRGGAFGAHVVTGGEQDADGRSDSIVCSW